MALPSLGGNTLTAQDVLDYAARAAETDQDVGVNLCQRFVRMAFGSTGGASTAVAAWQATPDKHTKGTPPPGAAVYWGGGAGHTAISAGNGMVYTTDWGSRLGKVTLVPMDAITQQWGKPLLGWTGQTNERRITKFNAQPVQGVGGGEGGTTYDPVYSGNTTAAGGGDSTVYSKKQLREKYGFAAAFFDQSPELQKLLDRAVKGQWTGEEFQARFMASKWYRKHTDAEQAWVLESTQKPAEAQKKVADKRADVVALYRNMGVPVSPDRLDKIVKSAVVHGWTDQELHNALAAEFDYKPDQTFGGVAGQTLDQFRQMSQQYLVPLSNDTLDKWTTSVLRGDADTASFQSYLKAQAASLFPELAPSLDQGLTVADYLSPYKETAARELGINPSEIDWFEPKWAQGVFQTDDTGARKVMGLSDWQKTLRTDKRFGFDSTAGAVDTASQFATSLATMMGRQ